MNMNEKENVEIVRTIIALAGSLGMEVTAEGIETIEQLSQLRAMACQYGQGYYLSKPMDQAAADAFIREHQRLQVLFFPVFAGENQAREARVSSTAIM
jgi:EAL domain-containing protein (putative c-di-GMP-specific phosphodiesterase class I)